MIDDEFESIDDTDPNDIVEIDPTTIIDKIAEYSPQKLCDIVVCERYLGINKKLAICCMEELGRRRVGGDNFDFETYIDNALKDMPILNFTIPDLGDVLRSFSGKLKK